MSLPLFLSFDMASFRWSRSFLVQIFLLCVLATVFGLLRQMNQLPLSTTGTGSTVPSTQEYQQDSSGVQASGGDRKRPQEPQSSSFDRLQNPPKDLSANRINATTTGVMDPDLPVSPDFTSLDSLPRWLQAYIRFHDATLHGHLVRTGDDPLMDTRIATTVPDEAYYLQWICMGVCGGTGDRISGILLSFYMALCSHRILVLDWKRPTPLSNYFQPNFISWDHSTADLTAIPRNQTSLSGHSNSVGSSNVFADGQQEHSIAAIDGFQNPYILDFDKLPKERHITIRTNVWRDTQNVSQQKCLKSYFQQFHDPLDEADLWDDRPDKDYYRMAFWSLFRWSPLVMDGVRQAREQLGLSRLIPDEKGRPVEILVPYVAVHIRTGRVKNINDLIRKESDERTWKTFYQCAKAFQSGMKRICTKSFPAEEDIVPIFLAADTSDVKEQFLEWDTDESIRTLSDMEIFHIDRGRVSDLKNREQAELDVFRDLKLLMDSTCLVFLQSKFSRMADWLPPQPRCSALYDKCTEETVRQSLSHLEGKC